VLLLLLQTAWRNLWRNKRRSWLTIGAIAFALTLALFQRGVQIGTYELNISSVTNYLTGHLQVQHLLKNLHLAVGDSAILLAPGYDGFLGDMYVRIVGTFQTGSHGGMISCQQ